MKRLGLPMIRQHTYATDATLCLAPGVHVEVISVWLGHVTTSFTHDAYMHAIPAVEEDAAAQIARIVFKGTSTPEPTDVATIGRRDHVSRDGDDAEDDNPSLDESYDESDGR